MSKLVAYLGVGETELFLDPDLAQKAPPAPPSVATLAAEVDRQAAEITRLKAELERLKSPNAPEIQLAETPGSKAKKELSVLLPSLNDDEADLLLRHLRRFRKAEQVLKKDDESEDLG